MKLSETLEKAFITQIGLEFYSSYAYLQMAAFCDAQHLPGMASWLRMQADEEWQHGLRFFDYVLERGNMVVLPAIEAPQSAFGSILELFEEVLEHEKRVSQEIRNLYTAAMEEKDFASYSVLQWFVNEQIEEENTAEAVVARLRMVEGHKPAILMIDHEMGQRTPGGEEG